MKQDDRGRDERVSEKNDEGTEDKNDQLKASAYPYHVESKWDKSSSKKQTDDDNRESRSSLPRQSSKDRATELVLLYFLLFDVELIFKIIDLNFLV